MSISGGLGGLNTGNVNNQQQQQQPSQGLGGLGGGIGGGIGGAQPQQSAPAPAKPSNVVSLKKGQKVSLAKSAASVGVNGPLSVVKVGLGWDTNKYDGQAAFDLDVFTFALKADGKVRDANDFVFYNNKQIPEGSIVLSGDNRTGAGAGDDESVQIDLTKIPPAIEKIAFCITINEAEARGQNFGMVDNAFARIIDANSGSEFMRYDLSEDYSVETALVVGELYKHNNEWKFRAVGSGYTQGLVALCGEYGVTAE